MANRKDTRERKKEKRGETTLNLPTNRSGRSQLRPKGKGRGEKGFGGIREKKKEGGGGVREGRRAAFHLLATHARDGSGKKEEAAKTGAII